MPRIAAFALFLIAVFLQGGAYGLTFLLPRLFQAFDANEKTVGAMLFITAIATLVTVYYSGHLTDRFGRVATLGLACLSISLAMAFYGMASSVGVLLVSASVLLGGGWGLTYALAPVVLTRLVKPDETVRYFALNSVFLMAGFGLSPVMAAQIEAGGGTVNQAFYAMAAISAVAGLVFFLLVRPVREHALNPGPEARSRIALGDIGVILRSRALLSVIMVCMGASVFAGMNNFQTVFADERGLAYAEYFLIYTITVVVFRILLAKFKGGRNPYLTISVLLYLMAGCLLLFLFSGSSVPLYRVVAVAFGIGYGASYPILAAMAARDAKSALVPQTLQLFALTYFVGIFGFPLLAGWIIVELGTASLLVLMIAVAVAEATMAAFRSRRDRLSGVASKRENFQGN